MEKNPTKLCLILKIPIKGEGENQLYKVYL